MRGMRGRVLVRWDDVRRDEVKMTHCNKEESPISNRHQFFNSIYYRYRHCYS